MGCEGVLPASCKVPKALDMDLHAHTTFQQLLFHCRKQAGNGEELSFLLDLTEYLQRGRNRHNYLVQQLNLLIVLIVHKT